MALYNRMIAQVQACLLFVKVIQLLLDIEFKSVYYHTKFERNWCRSFQMQASVKGISPKIAYIKLSSLDINCAK